MIPQNIGDQIRDERKSQAMSIETLAEKSNTSVAFISRLELHTPGSVSLSKIFQVLDALKLPPADVFGQPSIDKEEATLWTTLRKLPEQERREKINAILKLLN